MGLNSTDFAKNNSDMIILDNNLNALLYATLRGRFIYEYLKKIIQLQLTSIFVVIGISVLNSILIEGDIFIGIQMLWVTYLL